MNPVGYTKYLCGTAVPRCADATATILTNGISIGATMKKCTAKITHRTLAAAPKLTTLAASLLLAGMGTVPFAAHADTSNPVCPVESVFYDPGHGQDIVLPEGYKIEVFAKDLNFPTDVAFLGNKNNFKVFVLESGTGSLQQQYPGTWRWRHFRSKPVYPRHPHFRSDGHQARGPAGQAYIHRFNIEHRVSA